MTTPNPTQTENSAPVRSHDLLARCKELRDRWGWQALGLERTHGEDDPGAKALRSCIGDLYEAIRAIYSDEG